MKVLSLFVLVEPAGTFHCEKLTEDHVISTKHHPPLLAAGYDRLDTLCPINRQ